MIELEKLTLNDPIICSSVVDLNTLINHLNSQGYYWLNEYAEQSAFDCIRNSGYVYILISNNTNKSILWTKALNTYAKPSIDITNLGLCSAIASNKATVIDEVHKITPNKYVKIKCTFKKSSDYQNTIGHTGVVIQKNEFQGILTYRVAFYNFKNPATDDGCFIYGAREVEDASLSDYLKEVPDPDYEHVKKRFLNNKEKGEINKMKLLDIYIERKQNENQTKYRKDVDKVYASDSVYTALKKLHEDSKDKDGVERFEMPDMEPTKDMQIKLDTLKQDFYKVENEISNLKGEIEAQLELFETYEQKINVLKTYNVLDEAGKVNN